MPFLSKLAILIVPSLLAACLVSCGGKKWAIGTGDSFSGGGRFARSILHSREVLTRTFTLLQRPPLLERFCADQRELAAAVIPGILARIETVPIDVVPGPLAVNGETVRARFTHPTTALPQGLVEILQPAWESDLRLALLAHELAHASDAEDGALETQLDRFGECVLASYRELVESSATLMPDFGAEGYARWSGIGHRVRMAAQSTGKLLVGFAAIDPSTGHYRGQIRRLKQDGTLDTTFATNGTLLLPDRAGSGGTNVSRILVFSDDSFVVAGYETGARHTPILVRYDANGAQDQDFYDNAQSYIYANYTESQWYVDVALLPDGKLLAAGSAYVAGRYVYAVYRFHGDGRPDTTFHAGGNHAREVSPAGVASSLLHSFAVDSQGRFLLAGSVAVYGSVSPALGVVRLKSDGSFDDTFDGDGTAVVRYGTGGSGNAVEGLAVQSDGKILLAGYIVVGDVGSAAVLRLKADGSPDTTFGSAGGVAFPLANAAPRTALHGLHLTAAGTIVVVGRAVTSSAEYAAIARLSANGALDTAFKDTQGAAGYKLFGPAVGNVRAEAIVQISSGEIFAGGYGTSHAGISELFVAQFVGRDEP